MPHNGPGDMEELIAYANRRVRNNQHFVWASIGEPGTGKSEFNILFGSMLQGCAVDVSRQVAFKPKDRAVLARKLPRFRAVLDDESTGEGGNKKRTMSTANVDNGMDLDACRGRNQYVGFACPAWRRLDSTIQDHVMWLFVHDHNHAMKVYEMASYGPAHDRKKKPFLRFTVRLVPWLGDVWPDVREEYLKAKDDHMRGRNPNDVDGDSSLVEAAGVILSRVLGPAGLGPET